MTLTTNAATAKWTWADLASSYRFWGLIFYQLLFVFCFIIFNSFIYRYALDRDNTLYTAATVGYFMAALGIGTVTGFPFAWIMSKIRHSYILLLPCILYIAAIFILVWVKQIFGVITGSFLIGMSQGCVFLLVPALIGAAVGTVEAIIVSCGILLILRSMAQFNTVLLYGLSYIDAVYFLYFLMALIFLAIIFIIPIKKYLFNEMPAVRISTTQIPTYHNPIATFFLFFVPFYFIFWSVRVHREIRSRTQSPSLLTPSAAGWISGLVPFGFAGMISSLTSNLNQLLNQNKSTTLAVVLAILLPQLSGAIIQSRMNKL